MSFQTPRGAKTSVEVLAAQLVCDKERARERHRNRKSDGGKGRGPNPVYSRTTSS